MNTYIFASRAALLNSVHALITDEGSKPEILSRIAQTTAALTKLKSVWSYRSIFLVPR